MTKPAKTLAALAATACAALAAFASPASAGLLVQDAPDCTTPDSDQVFKPWVDYSNYFLAPDGGFESGADGWSLNSASVAGTNSPYEVSGDGTKALSLPNGSSATTPTICVGLEHPTLRFFVRKSSGTGLVPTLNSLRVDALVEDSLGVVSVLPNVGVVGGSSSWQPSGQMVVVASLLPLLPGSHTPVKFRFVPQGGNWQVDDVYVDPYAGR